MKNIIRTVSLMLCMVMLLGTMVFPCSAEENVLWTDENITLTFDTDTETLTVSGEGATDDYQEVLLQFESYLSPIFKNEDIKHVVVEEGITYLGTCLFLDCINIETVEFPNSLKEISHSAFEGCNKITSVEFPEGIKVVNNLDIGDIKNLTEVKFYGNFPEMYVTIFRGFKGTVYYPANNPTWTDEVIEELKKDDVYNNITWESWEAPKIERADNRFVDVEEGAWYIDGVQYVYENDVMSGTGDAKFNPSMTLSRAQMVQILFNMSGEKVEDYMGESEFADVEADSWYTAAVNWASQKGVTAGIGGGMFGVKENVSRQQLVKFLYNYFTPEAVETDLSDYTDAEEVSDWALEAIQWAVGAGVVSSTSESALVLAPKNPVMRAGTAAMLYNYLNK